MIRRFLDIVLALAGLIILLPLFIFISTVILISSGWPVFYVQKRVGKNNRDFGLIKFRTMRPNADRDGLLTVGANDIRITTEGRLLRKYKLDELPQLINILKGEMCFVGPRPEVRKYVELYNSEQQKVLSVRPGLTDLASVEYIHENELLKKYPDPEKAYIEIIMPAKLELNLKYLENQSIRSDIQIMAATIISILNPK
jgi:lipopolysaccharide/colanic/teichoic acid biosynthesis glycosyltransferase